MAATNIQSGDEALNSPRVSSPWSHVVRGDGGESEHVSNASPVVVTAGDSAPAVAVPAPASPSWTPVPEDVSNSGGFVDDFGTEEQADGSDNSGGGGGGGSSNVSKKPVWNRPSNGVVDAFNPIMGAAWPALGESTKSTLKSSSSESLKTLSDGSLSPALQVTGSSSPSHKQASAVNVNSSTLTQNHVAPSRQRSMKRGGGNSGANVSANGVVSVSQQPTSQDLVVELPHNTSGKVVNDHAHREPQKGGFVSQSHSGNEHHHQRGSYRRGGGGQHPRGDGSYHHSYGGKRDHDRGNQEWNQHSRSFNNRDTHFHSQRGFSRGYIRPSVHTNAQFIPPPMPVPMQPFGNNMIYPDVAPSVIYYPGALPPPMPFGAPLSPVYYSDPLLNANIVSQIDYYFSNENLVKDTYLRRNMDEQGWVSASLIAGFKKVSSLTDNVQLILDLMRTSSVVEVQGDKIRRRNDWMKWIMPAPGQYMHPSSPQANHEGLVSQVQNLALHGPASTNQVPVETQFSRSSSEEFTGGDGTVRVTSQQAGFDHASAA